MAVRQAVAETALVNETDCPVGVVDGECSLSTALAPVKFTLIGLQLELLQTPPLFLSCSKISIILVFVVGIYNSPFSVE